MDSASPKKGFLKAMMAAAVDGSQEVLFAFRVQSRHNYHAGNVHHHRRKERVPAELPAPLPPSGYRQQQQQQQQCQHHLALQELASLATLAGVQMDAIDYSRAWWLTEEPFLRTGVSSLPQLRFVLQL